MGAYISQADLEAIYGASNIQVWADVNSNGDAAAIAAQVADVIAVAEAGVEDRLRGGPYAVPLVAESGGSLKSITHAMALLACFELYRRRGLLDNATTTKMLAGKADAEATITAIAMGVSRPLLVRDAPPAQAPVVATFERVRESQGRVGGAYQGWF